MTAETRPTLRERASALKKETLALFIAVRDRRTPWYAKALGVLVVGYALSPIDLIPDFIPILGYLDDVILVPLGITIVLRLIPAGVMEDARRAVPARFPSGSPNSRIAAAVVITVWAAALGLVIWLIVRAASRR